MAALLGAYDNGDGLTTDLAVLIGYEDLVFIAVPTAEMLEHVPEGSDEPTPEYVERVVADASTRENGFRRAQETPVRLLEDR